MDVLLRTLLGHPWGSLAMSLIWPPQSCLNLVAFCRLKAGLWDEQMSKLRKLQLNQWACQRQNMEESQQIQGDMWQIPLATWVRDKAVLCGTIFLSWFVSGWGFRRDL